MARATPPAEQNTKTTRSRSSGVDAVTLLKNDHAEVSALFDQYAELSDEAQKHDIASAICLALKVHAQIEEELFYPEARKVTDDKDMLDEALVEHMGAKSLVAQIEAMLPGQPLYDAKVMVLGDQVSHHVREEEDELFPAVEASGLDLNELGARMAARQVELRALLSSFETDQ